MPHPLRKRIRRTHLLALLLEQYGKDETLLLCGTYDIHDPNDPEKIIGSYKLTKDVLVSKDENSKLRYQEIEFGVGKKGGRGAYYRVLSTLKVRDDKSVRRMRHKNIGVKHIAVLDDITTTNAALKRKIKEKADALDISLRSKVDNEFSLLNRVRKATTINYAHHSKDDTDKQNAFIVMSHVQGVSLHDFLYNLSRSDELDLRFLLIIGRNIVKKLSEVHDSAVVHRDFSWNNILINTQSLEVEIIDFGESVSDENATTTPHDIVTPGFTAPEAEEFDGKGTKLSDIFSFGKVLEKICSPLLRSTDDFNQKTELELLISQLCEAVPENRLSLAEALNRINLILTNLRQAHPQSAQLEQAAQLADRFNKSPTPINIIDIPLGELDSKKLSFAFQAFILKTEAIVNSLKLDDEGSVLQTFVDEVDVKAFKTLTNADEINSHTEDIIKQVVTHITDLKKLQQDIKQTIRLYKMSKTNNYLTLHIDELIQELNNLSDDITKTLTKKASIHSLDDLLTLNFTLQSKLNAFNNNAAQRHVDQHAVALYLDIKNDVRHIDQEGVQTNLDALKRNLLIALAYYFEQTFNDKNIDNADRVASFRRQKDIAALLDLIRTATNSDNLEQDARKLINNIETGLLGRSKLKSYVSKVLDNYRAKKPHPKTSALLAHFLQNNKTDIIEPARYYVEAPSVKNPDKKKPLDVSHTLLKRKLGNNDYRYEALESTRHGEGNQGVYYKIKATLKVNSANTIDYKVHNQRGAKWFSGADALRLVEVEEAALKHLPFLHYKPNVKIGNEYVLIMRHAGNMNLYDFLLANRYQRDESKKLTIEQKYNISINVLSALEQLHAKGIIHRDIKLENVIINPVTLEVTIIDYGLSKMKDAPDGTWSGGTPGYMAPEVFTSSDVKPNRLNESSDLFAAGMLISEIWGDFIEIVPPHLKEKDLTTTKKKQLAFAFAKKPTLPVFDDQRLKGIGLLLKQWTALKQDDRGTVGSGIIKLKDELHKFIIESAPETERHAIEVAFKHAGEVKDKFSSIATTTLDDDNLRLLTKNLDLIEESKITSSHALKVFLYELDIRSLSGLSKSNEVKEIGTYIINNFRNTKNALLDLQDTIKNQLDAYAALHLDKTSAFYKKHFAPKIATLEKLTKDITETLSKQSKCPCSLDAIQKLTSTFRRVEKNTLSELTARDPKDRSLKVYKQIITHLNKLEGSSDELIKFKIKLLNAMKDYFESTFTSKNIRNKDQAASSRRHKDMQAIMVIINLSDDAKDLVDKLKDRLKYVKTGLFFFKQSSLLDKLNAPLSEFKRTLKSKI